MRALNVLLNEIRKEFILVWSYRIQWLMEIAALVLFFFFLNSFSISAGHSSPEFSLLSYGMWFFSILVIGDVGNKLSADMRSGTFEQLCLAAVSINWLLIARVIASLCRALILFFAIIVPLSLLLSIEIRFGSCGILGVLLLCLIPGLIGISLLLGGVTLLIKEVGSLINIINNSLLFFSGAFVSLDVFPAWVGAVGAILPTSIATEGIRRGIDGLSMGAIFQHYGLNILLYSAAYLTIGILCFVICERRARTKGTLAHY